MIANWQATRGKDFFIGIKWGTPESLSPLRIWNLPNLRT